MRKFILFSILICISSFSFAKKIQAFLAYSTFNSINEGGYIESYLAISANSINYIKTNSGKYQGSVEITLSFKKDSIVKSFKKYNLLSPEIADSSAKSNELFFNLIDQQRISLPDGAYTMEIKIVDNNNLKSEIKNSQIIKIDFPKEKVSVSDIELVDSYKPTTNINIYSKNGYDLNPYVFNYFPEDKDKLIFYSEIYNTDKIIGINQFYLLSCYIQSYETNKKMSDFIINKRQATAPVNVVLNELSLKNLTTGNYNLVVEVRDKNNELVSSNKVFFQRNNPAKQVNYQDISALGIQNTFVEKYNNADSLFQCVRYLRPISTMMEKNFYEANFSKKEHDLRLMQQYFLTFWESRNSTNPEKAWLDYLQEVMKVNANYSTRTRKGYDTDRGRVYLQYGQPNSIFESPNSVGVGRYEIWHYAKVKTQSNRSFVFVEYDLVSNYFELIHSDVIGELSSPQGADILKNQENSSPGFQR